MSTVLNHEFGNNKSLNMMYALTVTFHGIYRYKMVNILAINL